MDSRGCGEKTGWSRLEIARQTREVEITWSIKAANSKNTREVLEMK
jgi:hypothetical protein